MISNFKGNLLESKCDVIAHCVNCKGKMGSGIALQIKNKWPHVFKDYVDFVKVDNISFYGWSPLGRCQVTFADIFYVANLFGQNEYGTHKRQVNYEAIYTALEELRLFMSEKNLKSVGFPKNMGSALAGGDWRIIEKMIECIFEHFDVEIWEFNK